MACCCAVVVEPLAAGDCAWLAPEAGGLALCVRVFVFDGELVCAWLDGVVVWLDGWLVWAWLVALFAAGACVVAVPVPELDDWPAAVCPVCEDWVWAEFADEFVCAAPEDELDEGLDVEVDGDVVEVESC